MKQFMNKLLGDTGDVSSKRLVGIFAFLVLVVMAMANLFAAKLPATFIFDGFLMIVLGCFGLNAAIEIFKKSFENKTK